MNQKNYDQSPLTDYLTSDKVDEILNEIKNNTLTEWHQFITLMSVFNFEDYPDSFVENILRLMHWLIDQNEAEKLLSIGKYDEFLLVCETEDSLSALEYAVSERNEDIAIRIIRYIKMIEKSHLLTNCPYHDSVGYIAVQTGQIHVVDELVKAGADHHFFCGHYTLLQHAAYIGDIKLALKCITEYCLDVNESVIVKTSPLSIATAQGNFDMVRILLDNGANPNLKDEWGKNALDYAVSPEITALLHANGAIEANDSDKKICTIGELLAELKYGEADKLYFELKKRSDYHYIYNDVDLLFCSLQYGNFSLAKRIINNGVECNSYDDSLYSAILAKYGIKSASDIREMIKFLCHNGFSLINKHQGIKRNENILHTSLFCMSFAREAEILDNLSFEEYTTFLDMLQDAGANFTQNYLYLQAAIEGLNTPLMHYCVNSGMTFDKLDKKINGSIISIFTDFVIFDEKSEDAYLHLLDFALSHGADINYQDSCGNTVLHHLAYSKSANSKDNILRALIKYGADKHIKNNRGLTPFSCACESGRPNAECTILRD